MSYLGGCTTAIFAGMSIVETSAAGDTASNWIVSSATMRDHVPVEPFLPSDGSGDRDVERCPKGLIFTVAKHAGLTYPTKLTKNIPCGISMRRCGIFIFIVRTLSRPVAL